MAQQDYCDISCFQTVNHVAVLRGGIFGQSFLTFNSGKTRCFHIEQLFTSWKNLTLSVAGKFVRKTNRDSNDSTVQRVYQMTDQ